MIRPGLAEFRKLAKPGRRVPVIREILADTDTPVSAFLKLCRGEHAFLLESVESGEKWSRYSILGTDPTAVYTARDGTAVVERGGVRRRNAGGKDPLAALESWHARQKPVPIEGLPPFWGGAVGFLAYDAVRHLEKLPDIAADDREVPDAVFLLADTVVVFDNLTLTLKIITSRPAGNDPDRTWAECVKTVDALAAKLESPLPHEEKRRGSARGGRSFRSSFTRPAFESAVSRAKERIRAGDCVQIVLSQRFEKRLACDPFDLYRALRVINPSSYMYYLRLGARHLVGSSPEVLVRTTGSRVELRPIAGTRRRGESRVEDAALEQELREDEKERAEHVMLVDLGRNDVGRVSEFGSVSVSEFMSVERYSHVMHLVSNVVGTVRPGISSLDVLRACFPAGTVSGAPKVRAMELIEELEPVRRATYAGAVGYLCFDGNLDTCIAIRAAFVEGGKVSIGSGAGIVADSDPATEWRETMNKAKALFAAVESAESRARRNGAAR
ncbi:MAG: anthranilate synthase component I [Candidatus Eiseniibacteriota bacterium]